MDNVIKQEGKFSYRLVNSETGAIEATGLLGNVMAKDLQNKLWKRVHTRLEVERQLTQSEWDDAWKNNTYKF